jgi:23S rRNA pseudouridine1911/1915/1917 synthase
MKRQQFSQTVQQSEVGRIDAWISKKLNMPRSRARGLVQFEGISLNGTMIKDPATIVSTGDMIQGQFNPQQKYRELPPERKTKGFEMVYLDDWIAVVNKSAGVLTVPTDRGESNNLIDLVSHHINRGSSKKRAVFVVHRLDRDTSGLLVFGRDLDSTKKLIDQFAQHKAERVYWAIVKGILNRSEGTIDNYLTTDAALNQKSIDDSTRRANPHLICERAITHYRTLRQLGDASLIEVRLETGRRNQIRVHFAEMGHPILGDTRYETELARHANWPYSRLALHAKTLGLSHPRTSKPLLFDCEIPQEFERFLNCSS